MSHAMLSISLPVDDLLRELEPHIEAEVVSRLDRLLAMRPKVRDEFTAMDQAINNVTRALVRVENSQNSRDEMPALRSLVAAATGLRRAHTNMKISKGH